MKKSPNLISVIVTTYNWPKALAAVLTALLAQKTSYRYEIIIADDGSGEETAKLIRSFKQETSMTILHIWQPDEGFRVSTIRNKAIVAAAGDYLLFLDGDCIPRENYIDRHYALAESGTFVAGNRILLNKAFTLHVLSQSSPLHRWTFWRWCAARLSGHCNRVLPFISCLHLIFKSRSFKRWQGAKGCNLGIWKADLFRINGWEETFSGWGYEDSELVIRLLRSNIQRKTARFQVPVVHLWHGPNDRTREQENLALLHRRQAQQIVCAERGLNQYAN
jgi:glycosyltransferase involved in cell wall biosynthesis